MTGFRPMLTKELREAWRTYRVPVVALLFLALGVTAPVVTRFLPDIIRTFAPSGFDVVVPTPDIGQVLDQLLKNTLQFGALAAVLLSMGSVATERERGTAAFVLSKPVTRAAFLLAKVVALAIQFAIAIALATAGAWIYTALLFEQPPILPWLELAAVVWLSTMVYGSITFLGSVVTRSSLGAGGIGFLGLIVLSLLSIIPTLNTWLPAGLQAVAKSAALSSATTGVDPVGTIGVAVGIVAVAVGLAWLRFRRAEL